MKIADTNENRKLQLKREKKNLKATLDVFHGNKLLGVLVPHEPGHPKIASSQILDSLVLIHDNENTNRNNDPRWKV